MGESRVLDSTEPNLFVRKLEFRVVQQVWSRQRGTVFLQTGPLTKSSTVPPSEPETVLRPRLGSVRIRGPVTQDTPSRPRGPAVRASSGTRMDGNGVSLLLYFKGHSFTGTFTKTSEVHIR